MALLLKTNEDFQDGGEENLAHRVKDNADARGRAAARATDGRGGVHFVPGNLQHYARSSQV